MERFKIIAPLAALLFALALPLGLGWNAHRAQLSGDEVRVRIEAYDPRDLLYGHYLTFRIKWPLPDKRASYGDDACLCVGAGAVDPPVSVNACDAVKKDPACVAVLKGRDYGGDRFDIGVNRYYVDERFAVPLETMIRRSLPTAGGETSKPQTMFHVGLTLLPSGKAAVRSFYIDDQPLAEYLREHGEELLKQ